MHRNTCLLHLFSQVKFFVSLRPSVDELQEMHQFYSGQTKDFLYYMSFVRYLLKKNIFRINCLNCRRMLDAVQVFHMTCVLCTSSKNNRSFADICISSWIGYKILTSLTFKNMMTDVRIIIVYKCSKKEKRSVIKDLQYKCFYFSVNQVSIGILRTSTSSISTTLVLRTAVVPLANLQLPLRSPFETIFSQGRR